MSNCEDDLVLEDECLYPVQYPPEHHHYSKILYPGKLEQLPEARVVGDSLNRVGEDEVECEVPRDASLPHCVWIHQFSGH